MERPRPPREANLIRLAREAAGITAPDAAKVAGISPARWSQVETGYESRAGRYKPVRARDATLAHMAYAVGLAPHRLDQVDREGAAEVLREILRQHAERIEAEDAAPGASDDVTGQEDLVEDAVRAALEHYRAKVAARMAEINAEREANGRSA